jgi:hypothetical protein
MPVNVKHHAQAHLQEEKNDRLQQTRGSFRVRAEEEERAPMERGERREAGETNDIGSDHSDVDLAHLRVDLNERRRRDASTRLSSPPERAPR